MFHFSSVRAIGAMAAVAVLSLPMSGFAAEEGSQDRNITKPQTVVYNYPPDWVGNPGMGGVLGAISIAGKNDFGMGV